MKKKRLKPRKIPVQARSAKMVRLILEAAARVLEMRGLEGYTTNAVAERAGISIGSLYQYFSGKDALTAALIEQEGALRLEGVARIDPAADGITSLRQLISTCVAHQMRRPVLARLLDLEEERLPLHEQQRGESAGLTHVIKSILGKLPNSVSWDLTTAAADVLSLTRGMVDGAGERGETDTEELERRVERAVFGYLGVSEKLANGG